MSLSQRLTIVRMAPKATAAKAKPKVIPNTASLVRNKGKAKDVSLPGAINVERFVEARAMEIQAFQSAIRSAAYVLLRPSSSLGHSAILGCSNLYLDTYAVALPAIIRAGCPNVCAVEPRRRLILAARSPRSSARRRDSEPRGIFMAGRGRNSFSRGNGTRPGSRRISGMPRGFI